MVGRLGPSLENETIRPVWVCLHSGKGERPPGVRQRGPRRPKFASMGSRLPEVAWKLRARPARRSG